MLYPYTTNPLQHNDLQGVLVGPVGFEPTTNGFTFRTFPYGVGLYHHPRRISFRVRVAGAGDGVSRGLLTI